MSGGIGKKLASAKEIMASQELAVFFLANERVQSYVFLIGLFKVFEIFWVNLNCKLKALMWQHKGVGDTAPRSPSHSPQQTHRVLKIHSSPV